MAEPPLLRNRCRKGSVHIGFIDGCQNDCCHGSRAFALQERMVGKFRGCEKNKKGKMEVEVVLESLGVFQDAKIVFKETTTQPWQDPFKTGGGLAVS